MIRLILLAVTIGNIPVTAYRSVPNQTDNSPFLTSIGEHVCKDGVAVSQDLLEKNGGPLRYGDWIYIEDIGLKRVNDTMHPRITQHIDVWVKTLGEEKRFWERYKNKRLKIYRVQFMEE